MTEPGKAVFLSYASQDAEAAKRICESLCNAGLEVWFDQSELRGGDAWDQKIRKQIKECALFVPIISANTQARPEGYFRLEWHLAEQRSHLIAHGRPFIVPIAIDDTGDAEALVPDAFVAVQWIRVPRGDATAELAAQFGRLLTPGTVRPSRPTAYEAPISSPAAPGRRHARRYSWLKILTFGCLGALAIIVAGIVALSAFGGWIGWRARDQHPESATGSAAANPPGGDNQANAKPAAPAGAQTTATSPARELTQRAQQILAPGSLTRAQLDAAGELCDRALQLDPTDPLVWAKAADVELRYIYPYGYDRSDERRRRAEERATRATTLGPDLFQVRLIQAEVYAHAIGTPALMAEAEKMIKALRSTRPDDKELVQQLAEVLREEKRFNEAAQLFEHVGEFEVAGWSYFEAGELRSALAAVRRAPRTVTALQLRTNLEYGANEDLDAAQAVVNQFQPSELLAEMPATDSMRVAIYRRDPQRLLELAQGLPNEFIDSNAFRGPRKYFTGVAYELSGRPIQAETEWRAALNVLEARLNATPDDRLLLLWASWLHAALHDLSGAERTFARNQALAGLDGDTMDVTGWLASLPTADALLRMRKTDALLAGLDRLFRAKPPNWELVHADMRFSPDADYLRGDPRFEKLLRDNLPPGAKPFPDQKLTTPSPSAPPNGTSTAK